MLNDFSGADRVYIACGYTDLRKGIDGLARMVQQQFELLNLARYYNSPDRSTKSTSSHFNVL